MKLINKIEYFEQEELIQVLKKEKVEQAIAKENTSHFRLAYTSPLLKGDSYEDLSISGKEKLAEDFLQDQAVLQEYSKIKEVM